MSDFALFHQEKKGLGVRGWSLLLAASLIFLDQVTKWVITQALALHEAFSLFPGFALTLRHNQGAAFSFLAEGSGWQRWLFVSLAILISALLYVWLGRLAPRDKREAIALSFILGGALGNLWDRLYHGYVVDFILVYYKDWQWPAFNVADSAITIGACLFALGMFKKH